MRAINHAMTGALIGLTVHEPVIALPAAFVSHYALDVIPHFGERIDDHSTLSFRVLLVGDMVACIALVLILVILRPKYWLQAAICAFVAAAPDFMWLGNYLRELRGQKPTPNRNIFVRIHKKIQWYELPPGALVEVMWGISCIVLLSIFL